MSTTILRVGVEGYVAREIDFWDSWMEKWHSPEYLAADKSPAFCLLTNWRICISAFKKALFATPDAVETGCWGCEYLNTLKNKNSRLLAYLEAGPGGRNALHIRRLRWLLGLLLIGYSRDRGWCQTCGKGVHPIFWQFRSLQRTSPDSRIRR